MDGEIDVTSQPGKGTRITVTIPLEVSSERSSTRHKLNGAQAVLLCEDGGTTAMVTSHLRRLGAKTKQIVDANELTKSILPDQFFIIDYDFLVNHPDSRPAVSNLDDDRVIVLAPLTIKSAFPEIDRWKVVTKPITLSSIYDSTFGFIREGDNRTANLNGQDTRAHEDAKCRILVAEDVEVNQRIATEMLHLLDFDVEIAENGSIALDKYKSGSYILIFMDCQMPVLDGFAATRKIREFEKLNSLPSIPIIALTAGIGKEDRQRCIDAGMDAYLTKPFSISEISESIGTFENAIKDRKKKPESPEPDAAATNDSKPGVKHEINTEIFNIRAINNIREVEEQTGRSLLPSILDGFTTQMHEKLEEISENLKEGNPEKLYKTAHAIKSMSANIGAERVRSISAEVEVFGRAGKIGSLSELLLELSAAYEEFIQEFRTNFIS
jgi:CheY-like chemotaxis protein